MFSWITDLDVNILYYVQNHLRGETLNKMVQFFTSLGNYGLIWILLTIALILCSNTRKVGIKCAVALIIDLILCNVLLKNIVARTRPYDAYENIRCLLPPQVDYSFPSGHTASSFAVTMPVLLEKDTRFFGKIVLILAIMMALSRIYVCVHYPSDVFCGIILGIFCGVLSCYIINRYTVKRS